MLNRRGSKAKIAHQLIPYFHKHDVYIDLFFGAGGIYFYKPRAKYNICNDLDGEVFNFWSVYSNPDTKAKLLAQIEMLPTCQDIFNYFKTAQYTDPIQKALAFFMLSNYGLYSAPSTMRIQSSCPKKKALFFAQKLLIDSETIFLNLDFRRVLGAIKDELFENKIVFVYADPPYIDTARYNAGNFRETDTEDLFAILVNSSHYFAISEFSNIFVLDLASKYGLNVIEVCDRRSIKKRSTEILITNYLPSSELF